MCVIVLTTATENVLEVLVVLVGPCRLLSSHVTLLSSLGVDAKRAGCRLGYSSCAAIADEVALVEELDQSVFAMARDGA